MIHPLLRLIATQPELLADHVSAYASLIGSEARQVQQRVTLRVMLVALALCCIGVAAVLAGVALMLWAVIPPTDISARWALSAAPVVSAVVVCVDARRRA